MKFTFDVHPPCYGLNRFVEMFWYADGFVDYTREKVLPNGVVEWIFNVSNDVHWVVQANGKPVERLYPESWMAGIQDKPLVIQSLGETKLFGIRFKPGGARPFLSMPLNEMTNDVENFDSFMGRTFRDIPGLLADAEQRGRLAQFAVLERLLLSRLDESRIDSRVEHAVALLTSSRPLHVSSVATDIGVSHKHLVERFHERVGIAPKTLQRVARFQRAVRALASVPWSSSPDLAGLAVDLGYSDQPHMNREFREFAGSTPVEYMRMRTFDENHVMVR